MAFKSIGERYVNIKCFHMGEMRSGSAACLMILSVDLYAADRFILEIGNIIMSVKADANPLFKCLG